MPDASRLSVIRSQYLVPFGVGAGAAAAALVIVSRYFSHSYEMATSALIAISLGSCMERFLDENRRAIWEERIPSFRANSRLAAQLLAVFLGVLCAALCLQLGFPGTFLPAEEEYEAAFRNELYPLFMHNVSVFTGAFIFGLLYRAGGLVVVLAWNALYWSRSFVELGQSLVEHVDRLALLLSPFAILPHLIWEVVAYVLAGMAGVFMSKAALKYNWQSDAMSRVSRACVYILIAGIGALAVSCLLEIYVAQSALNSLRGPG